MEWKTVQKTEETKQIQQNQQNQQTFAERNAEIIQKLQTHQAEQAERLQNYKEEGNRYDAFFQNMQPLPAIPIANDFGPQEENTSRKERNRRKKAREKEIEQQEKDFGELRSQYRIFTAEEIENIPLFRSQEGRKKWFEKKTKHSKSTMGETLTQVKNGDFSNFENLDVVMRNMVASQALNKLMREYNPDPNMDARELCDRIKRTGQGASALMNPALRLGLSLAQRTDAIPKAMRDFYRRLDEAMSTAIMVETLTTVPHYETLRKHYEAKGSKKPQADANKAIHANGAQQVQIAKRLLLMQLSDFKMHTGQKENEKVEDWNHSMAVALSHCSRVVLTLPKQDKTTSDKETQKRMWQSIYTIDGTNFAEDNRRGSSTHDVERKKVSEPKKGTKEKKVKFNLFNQRGMNVAIGGLGNDGISGKMLSNDGSCGHFYSMYKEADYNHYGAMLIGLESDASGVTNQMGHTHSITAKGEQASSLGGQRVDEIGNKYGGRTCDLTHMSAQTIGDWMLGLEKAMERWYRSPKGMANEEAVKIMEMLAGKKMDAQDWDIMKQTLGILY